MADRSIVVRLRAEIGQYETALRQAGNATDVLGRRVNTTSDTVRRLTHSAIGLGAAIGVTGLVKDAVQLEAAFSKTMAQVAIATAAPKRELEELDALAMRMGQDTVYSANEAAQAMLELTKGGLTSAQIQGGALAETMTLAAAGGMQLDEAANSVVQTMGAFGLSAKQTGAAVAALAGAANASSADVSDITQALSQAGTSAAAAGLSIQDTTAFLALFADSGIQGSDAGTSLRTMLTRLVPQTKEAASAMDALGLSYLDGNGKLVSAEEIAKRTQKAFSGLSDEQKISAANTIFGADAQRAVNVLTAEGVEGFEKYKTATSDLTQAQKLAEAANSGTAGSLEELSGQIETALLQIGKGLAPTIQDLSGDIGDLIEGGDFQRWASEAGTAVQGFIDTVAPVASSTLPLLLDTAQATGTVLKTIAPLVEQITKAYNSLPESAQTAILLGAGATYLANKVSPLRTGPAAAAAASTTAGGAAAGGAARGTALGALARTTLGRSTGVIGIAGILGEVYNDKLLDSLPKRYEDLRQSAMTANEKQRETLQLRDQIFGEDLGGGGGVRGALWAFQDLGEKTMLAAAGMGQYADELVKLPVEVTTKISTPGAVESIEDVVALSRQYGLTPEEIETIMRAKDFATRDIQEVVGYLYSVNGETALLRVDATTRAARQAIGGLLAFANSLPGISIPINPQAIGGFHEDGVQRYAAGGFDERGRTVQRVPQVRNGGQGAVMWGEAETGWEAYISGKPGMEDRNRNVLAIAAGRLGMQVTQFADGGFTEAAGRLETLQMRIRVRDLQRSLRETEEYGSGKTKRRRLRLRGMDRTEAQYELSEARRELAATLRANNAARRMGMGAERYNDYRQNQIDGRQQLADDRRSAARSFAGNGDLSSLRSPAAVQRSLAKSIVDMATFTELLIALKKKGAAPWLLGQLQAAGPTREAIRLAQQYLSDSSALASVGAQAKQLEAISNVYGQVTSAKQWTAPKSWSGGVSAAQMAALQRSVQVTVTAQDPSVIARQTRRLLEAELNTMAAGAGV